MSLTDDMKKICFGYFVLGFCMDNADYPRDPVELKAWLHEKFEQEWQDTALVGRDIIAKKAKGRDSSHAPTLREP